MERHPERGDQRADLVPLDRNERLAPLPDWFLDELRAELGSDLLTRYPRLDELYADLSEALGLPEDRLLATPGSDAAFRALFQAYVAPGQRVVFLEPSYAMYAVYARLFRAEAVAIPFAQDLTFDADALIEAVGGGARLVLIPNPNQPTGTTLDADTRERLVDAAAEAGALVVVDEAYFPFSGSTLLPEIAPHVVVTRTLSKATGLAGLRIGFAAASPEVIRNMRKVRSVYDVNAFAAVAARKLLAHPEIATDYVAQVDEGRELLSARARSAGLEPLPGVSNFLLIRLHGRIAVAELAARLRERDYLIKAPLPEPLTDDIRVTLGPPELMREFADALDAALAG